MLGDLNAAAGAGADRVRRIPGGAHSGGSAKLRAQAQKLLAQGVAALARRDIAAASQALSDAYRTLPSAENLFYLGTLAFADNRVLSAQDLMGRYLADPQLDLAATSSEQQEAQRILALPRPAHGNLNIIGDAGTLISLDSRVVGILPLSRPLLVSPGQHTVTLQHGAEKQEETVQVPDLRFVELRHNWESRTMLMSQLPGVMLLPTYEGMSAEEQKSLNRAFEETVLREHYTTLSKEQALDAVRDPEINKCLYQMTCQADLAERTGVDFVLLLQARRQGADLGLQVPVLDAHIGELCATSDKTCESCSQEQAVLALVKILPALLLQSANRQRGSIEVTSKPTGAEVRIGSRLLGRTPVRKPLWIGSSELDITLPGYLTQHQRVQVEEGVEAKVQLELHPIQAVRVVLVPEAGRRSFRSLRLGVGGTAVGIGVLMLGFGVSGLAINGSCSAPPIAADGLCLETYHTGAVGGTLTAFGSGLLIGGALLLAIPERRRLQKEKADAKDATAFVPSGPKL